MRPTFKHSRVLVAAFALLLGASTAAAQDPAPAAKSKPEVRLSETRAALVDTAEEYKASTEDLLRLKEAEADTAARRLGQLRQLFADGIISKRELEESERTHAASLESLEALRRQIADSDRLIADTIAAEELAKSQAALPATAGAKARVGANATLIRYTGRTSWSLADLYGLQAFFSSTFGRPLPTSAVGQTSTHDRLGFDHRHAVDVPLHPDSAEGRALIAYLQSRGITFMAFRSAVPGSSTGPHIHIGRPSQRIA